MWGNAVLFPVLWNEGRNLAEAKNTASLRKKQKGLAHYGGFSDSPAQWFGKYVLHLQELELFDGPKASFWEPLWSTRVNPQFKRNKPNVAFQNRKANKALVILNDPNVVASVLSGDIPKQIQLSRCLFLWETRKKLILFELKEWTQEGSEREVMTVLPLFTYLFVFRRDQLSPFCIPANTYIYIIPSDLVTKT